MAKRGKLNKKFLTLLLIISAILVFAGGVYYYRAGTGLKKESKDKKIELDTTLRGSQGAERAMDLQGGEDLTDAEKKALVDALDDEYKAQATYQAIIGRLGSNEPFDSLLLEEEDRIDSLVNLYLRYGLEIFPNDYPGNIELSDTLEDSCKWAAEEKEANIQLYETLLSDIEKPDIIEVFEALRQESRDDHLPAFENCE